MKYLWMINMKTITHDINIKIQPVYWKVKQMKTLFSFSSSKCRSPRELTLRRINQTSISISDVNICNDVWFFTFMRIKIYELTCKRRLQWKKFIEILSEVTTCQSQHFLKNLSFYSSSEAEKLLVAHTFEKILRFEKKLEDKSEFEEKYVWWHSLVRKTHIFWEISDLRKSRRWWPWGLSY